MLKKLLSFFLVVVTLTFPTVCFAAELPFAAASEIEWEQMMRLAEETFPELKADMQQSIMSLPYGTSAVAESEAETLGHAVFHDIRATSDGAPIYETMGIKIEVGGDAVKVYVNGELMLHDV